MKLRVLLRVLPLVPLVFSAPAQAAWITGVLSNFDVRNITVENADDFHLIIDSVSCTDIIDGYDPPDWVFSCLDLPEGGLVVSWQSLTDLVLSTETRHFGVEFEGNPQFRVRAAYWTYEGRILFPWISFVNQRWEDSMECWVDDLLDGYPRLLNLEVTISNRDFAWSDTVIQLSDLTWETTEPLYWTTGIQWEDIPNDPEYESLLEIPSPGWPIGGTLVRYDLWKPGFIDQAAIFTNEVLWDSTGIIESMLSGFEVINFTDYCVDAFHLSLRGVITTDFANSPNDFYAPSGWSVVCADHTDGGGCDIAWTVTPGSCLEPEEYEWFQLGFGLEGVPWFQVRAAWWASEGIPVSPLLEFVNQIWYESQVAFETINVLQGYDRVQEIAGMQIGIFTGREFAYPEGQPIPLDMLTWEETAYLDCQLADQGTPSIPPDPEYSDAYRFEPWMTEDREALLIRYETWDSDDNMQVRFTNEALIATSAPPPPEDLRIQFMGMAEPDVMHFRLEWTPPLPIDLRYNIIQREDFYDPAFWWQVGWTTDTFYDLFLPIEHTPWSNRLIGFHVTAEHQMRSQ